MRLNLDLDANDATQIAGIFKRLVDQDQPFIIVIDEHLLFSNHLLVDSDWHWESVDQKIKISSQAVTVKEASNLAKKHEFCLTGDGIEHLRESGNQRLLGCILPKTKVLSRVAPNQKEYVLATLRELGYTTLMCGDGTNDVGALKQAHIGEF